MQKLSKILVCLDPNEAQQPALDKAIYLAKMYRSDIELLLVVYNRSLIANWLFSPEQLEVAKQGYINSQEAWLTQYRKQVEAEAITVQSKIVWHKPLYESIIDNAIACKADLVIKSTHHHPTINKVFFTPNDWQLLKSCPVPLILAKSATAENYKKLLAGIDPSRAHGKPEWLDSKIVSMGLSVASTVNAECHVTHCYSPLEYQLWSDIGMGMGVGLGPTDFAMGEGDYKSYAEELKSSHEKQFEQALDEFDIGDEFRHLVEGYPEQILPELVDKMDIDLLVLGTIYHSGLVGSTAEKILDQVNCDVLSVNVAVEG